jgi:hypothetical protein
MLCVGFKPTIPASEQAKTVHALDRSATVTGFETGLLKMNQHISLCMWFNGEEKLNVQALFNKHLLTTVCSLSVCPRLDPFLSFPFLLLSVSCT